VLFPGEEATTEPLRWRSLLLLLAIPGVLLYGCLWFHLFEPDEGRYAEIPREMLARGDWIVPYLQGEPYLDKPPLLYWLVMGCYRLFGIHAWAARLVPALAIHGCILLTYLFGRRLLGERAAFWGALLLSMAPGFVTMGRLLILDGLLAFCVTLSLYATFEAIRGPRMRPSWGLLAAVACGLGILAKGPVAVVLLIPPFWAYRHLAGRSCRVGWVSLLLFSGVVLAITLPWYVAICCRLPEFARYFLWQQNVVRFVAPFDHLKPIWFYAPILLVGLLPGSLLVVPFLRFLISGHAATVRQRCPELGFVLLTGGWCVLFFSLSGCKLPTYVLPAFPPLALALGYYLATRTWESGRWPKLLASSAFVVVFLGHNVLLPWYAGYRAPLARLADVRPYCQDRHTPIVCYSRSCDSIAFYIERDDLRSYRSKQTPLLVQFLEQQPRTVLLLTHRHSLDGLRYVLPPDLEIVDQRHFGLGGLPGLSESAAQKISWLMGETSLGLCDLAVVQHKRHL
jgi:4-amino-4-deoxy-L-arabinose transferase-like glycosyltransferase